ncbi:tyrosine-type recombinase/integrase [Campylobacter devanensis]|uniref:tyrosine-type recombinase/integrase n=1 Tax=Campylobacter devanensis TaxID=3161138 RepID=UPI000A33DA2D|nr:integrase arm-type DNA-binding domain-containing protein [Campylobacter sp. P0108]
MKIKSFTTDSQLKAITLPQDTKELIIKDESTPNLIVRIRPNNKTFLCRIKINGKIKKYTIGQYPLISLATARQEAIRLKAQITQGIDPTLKELTFNEVAQIWLKHKSKQNLATFKKIESRLNNHIIPKLGNIKIQDLKRDRLIKCVLESELKDNGGDGFETKTKIFGILKEILKFIAIHGLIHDYISPLADLNFGDICKDKHTTTHHRYIQEPKRLKEFLDAIENYKGNILTKYALKMGVYTALRSQTLRTLKWEYIDYTKEIINIPKEQMKTKKPFILPLTNQIKAILKELEPYKLGHNIYLALIQK